MLVSINLAFLLSFLTQQRVLHQSDSISKIDLRERKKMIWPPGPYSLMSNLWYITASCPAAWAWMNKATRTLSMFLSLFINGYIGSLASSLLIYYLCYIRHCSWEDIFLGLIYVNRVPSSVHQMYWGHSFQLQYCQMHKKTTHITIFKFQSLLIPSCL